jgi:NhaP-type Na+/H+ or K+/H+ antiporter
MFIQFCFLKHRIVEFDQQSFFFFLLPPIVFASAYTLQKKTFLKNIQYIFGLGILGTIIAMCVISAILLWGNEYYAAKNGGEKWVEPEECLLLASVLASTDTVAVLTLVTADKYMVLNAVLFGEGVVNDAVTILLYQAVNRAI